MSSFTKIFYVLCLFAAFRVSVSIEPISSISAASAVVLSAAFAAYEYTKCKRSECCQTPWIKLDGLGLKNALKHSLHGQHLVEHIVSRAINGHLKSKEPEKALVLAFHGWTGSGKNYVSKLIADNLFEKGMESSFVHLYLASKHFGSDRDIEEYKEKLKTDIERFTAACPYNLFIFDELDKMPSGLLDVLKPYIDYYDKIDGVNYRRNIFIFLSNTGGKEISRVAFEFWYADRRREDITLKDVESYISRGAFNEKGGLKNSEIIERELIDIYVPFLPLERKHVKLCINDILRSRSHPVSNDVLEAIADEMEYRPEDFKLYSASGCKKVQQKIDIHISSDDIWE